MAGLMVYPFGLPPESVTVVSAGTLTDPYSNAPAESWDPADVTERDVELLAPPEPRPSQEPVQDARNAVTSGWTLYLPAGDSITSRDRVTVRGTTYRVEGEPADWGVGVVVQAFRTEG